MRVLDVVITAEHASIESEIMSVILSYAQPIEAALVVDSQKYPYLVGFRAKLSFDRLRMLVFGWPCKSSDPGEITRESFRHSPLEVGFVNFIPDVPHNLRWRIQIECTLSSAKPVFDAIVIRLRGLYELQAVSGAAEVNVTTYEFPYPFKGTPAQFGVMAGEFDKELVVGGARYPYVEGPSGVISIEHLRSDANLVTVSYYENSSIWRLEIRALYLPDGKSRLRVKIDDASPAAKQKWESLRAEMERLGFLDNEQLGAGNVGVRPIHIFDKGGAVATPVGTGADETAQTFGALAQQPTLAGWKGWPVTQDPVTSASTFTDPTKGDRVIAIPQSTRGAAEDGHREQAKGGRPRNADDDWAWAEVREKMRNPEDVYPEWLARIGTRATTLADTRDSFNKAIKASRKK